MRGAAAPHAERAEGEKGERRGLPGRAIRRAARGDEGAAAVVLAVLVRRRRHAIAWAVADIPGGAVVAELASSATLVFLPRLPSLTWTPGHPSRGTPHDPPRLLDIQRFQVDPRPVVGLCPKHRIASIFAPTSERSG